MDRLIRKRRLDPVFNAQPCNDDARTAQRIMGTSLRSVRYNANADGYKGPDKCWDGYEKVEGIPRGKRGSCRRKKRPSKTREGEESSTDESSDDEKKETKKSDK